MCVCVCVCVCVICVCVCVCVRVLGGLQVCCQAVVNNRAGKSGCGGEVGLRALNEFCIASGDCYSGRSIVCRGGCACLQRVQASGYKSG